MTTEHYSMINFPLLSQSLGQVGRVIKVFSSGDVRVGVNNKAWTFNPLAMNPAPGEDPPEVAGKT